MRVDKNTPKDRVLQIINEYEYLIKYWETSIPELDSFPDLKGASDLARTYIKRLKKEQQSFVRFLNKQDLIKLEDYFDKKEYELLLKKYP
jgi:hypothetical protein